MPSRQINDFLPKKKQKKIELVSRPEDEHPGAALIGCGHLQGPLEGRVPLVNLLRDQHLVVAVDSGLDLTVQDQRGQLILQICNKQIRTFEIRIG